jgi:prepilin-type N-terminal cleavage/methylation domain-containing protein
MSCPLRRHPLRGRDGTNPPTASPGAAGKNPAPTLRRKPGSRRGFTLIELGVVIVIIGLIISFVLVASFESLQRAQIRATQGLIAKLDSGITERLEALLQQRIEPTRTHRFLSAIYPPPPGAAGPWGLPSDQRASVIATFDYIKAEMPDVFLFDTNSPAYSALYPVNFAAQPYPAGSTGLESYALPLGHATLPPYIPGSLDASNNPTNLGPGDWDGTGTLPQRLASATGILGASWAARASFNKLLGYPPAGYDQADNDGNGLVDELTATELRLTAAQFRALQTEVLARLGRHTHKTARSEALYALLVGGLGPLGSIYSPEDFSPTEIGDTDGDGLPEFIDAWGEPLQFYRWPIHYPARSLQRGWLDYPIDDPTVPREQDPLDPNNHLVAPAWWAAQFNIGAPNDPFNTAIRSSDPYYCFPATGAPAGSQPSSHAAAFMYYFHSLVEYRADPPTNGQLYWWSRTGTLPRRAYFSRPLIISSGPDQQLGLGQCGFDYSQYGITGTPPVGVPATPSTVIAIENTAANHSPFRATDWGGGAAGVPFFNELTGSPSAEISGFLKDANEGWGLDDIGNLSLQSASGGLPQ